MKRQKSLYTVSFVHLRGIAVFENTSYNLGNSGRSILKKKSKLKPSVEIRLLIRFSFNKFSNILDFS